MFRAQGRGNLENQELDKALRLKPGLLAARLALARNFVLAKQPMSALDLLDQAPGGAEGRGRCGHSATLALLAAGKIVEAQKLLDRELAEKRIPEQVGAAGGLSENGTWRDYLGARADAEECLKSSPEDVRAARIVVEAYVARNERGKAEERLVEIVARRPKSAPLQNLLGEWYKDAGRLDDARKAFEAAKAADSSLRAADLALVEIDRAQGRSDAARQRLAGMVAADAGNITALLLLADIEDEAAGNRAGAMVRYRSVRAGRGQLQSLCAEQFGV